MRFATSTLLVAALGSLAAAQLNDLPKCAQACFGSSFGSCAQLDVACICGNATLITALSCCVASTCTPAEQNSTVGLADNLCAAAGVKVPTAASCSGSASNASPSPAPTASGGSSSNSHSPAATGATTSSHSSGAGAGASPTPSGNHSAASGSKAAGVPMATAGAMGIALGIVGAVFAL